MRFGLGQELRPVQTQQQKLILAPRMIQSMEILQLPILALQERIEQELQENAVLELEESDPDLPEQTEERENPDQPTTNEQELVVDDKSGNKDDFERLLEMSDDWGPDYFEERPRLSSNRIDEDSERQHDAMANMVDRPVTLQDYLREQLRYFELDELTRQMAERILYALDDNGRLPVPLEDLVDVTAADEQLQAARRALMIIQRLEPPGVAARDLRECLLLQLTPHMAFYDELKNIIANHLDDLESNKLPAIQRRTGYSLQMIQTVIGELKKLNPKPGSEFNSTPAPSVLPDVFVDRLENGTYRVRMEEGDLPRLFISPYYRRMLRGEDTPQETREYIKRKINSAQWLIESIDQRRNTLRKVAQAIVDHQTEFLEKGPEFIHPLKMQQIADKVGVHVTTVSRAVDDKWVQTPRGIFALKRFFGGGTAAADGSEVAYDAVRLKLQEIIDHEDKKNPFSDDELVKELARNGIKVARRTVTKYRKAMKIPSSRQRRDWTLTAASAPADSNSESNGVAPAENSSATG
jgi:RNA polymerase sigma-54 factor